MVVLHIEHPVPSYDGWKKTFDADPIDRKASGVRRYTVFRSVTDPNHVVVDLEFDNPAEAELTLQKLQTLWNKVQGTVITSPKAQLFEVVESAEV